MRLLYTIKTEDIGKKHITVTCPCCHKKENYYIQDLMGYIMPIDVDKRIYLSDRGLLYVENQEQLEARLGRIKPEALD